MASIRQRGDRWQCRVKRQGYPDVTKTFLTKDDAQRWARSIERQMDLGEYAPIQSITETLGDILDRYEKQVTPSKRGALQEKYRLAVVRADKIGCLNLKAVTPAEIASFRDRRLAKVKASTVLHDLCTLSAVFEHARLEWSYPVSNPVRSIRKPSMDKGRDRRLQDGEYDRLLPELEKCRNPFISHLFVFSVETACRRGEALKLKWSDVDLNKRLAVFRQTKTGEDRVIPLSTKAIQTLQALPRSLCGQVFPVRVPTVRSAVSGGCKLIQTSD